MYVSVGYGSQELEEFLQSLVDADIAVLVDTISSKSRPEFHCDENYAMVGVKLVHDRERMRGHRSRQDAPGIPMETNAGWRGIGWRYLSNYYMTDPAQQAIRDMIALHGKADGNVGYMCCEPLPWNCHRNVISGHLANKVGPGNVMHLIGNKLCPHKVWGANPVVVNGIVTYPRKMSRPPRELRPSRPRQRAARPEEIA